MNKKQEQDNLRDYWSRRQRWVAWKRHSQCRENTPEGFYRWERNLSYGQREEHEHGD